MRSDIRENWSSKTGNDMSEIDWKAHLKRREKLSKQLQEDAEFKASEAAIKAQGRWVKASPADDSHPYLLTKNVSSHGLRVEGENLLIPCYQFDDEAGSFTISTLQTISPSGEKLFMAGGTKKGSFYEITSKESPKDQLILCEGFATGASIFEATGIST
jgi:putative DNA primase/helicase